MSSSSLLRKSHIATDIRCHTLVWNLGYLVFSQPSCQLLPNPMLKSLSEGVPSLAKLLGVSNDNLNQQLLSLSGFGWISEKVVDHWRF
jgi:hypothetical protein